MKKHIVALLTLLLLPSLSFAQTPFNFSTSRGLSAFGGPNPTDSLPYITSFTSVTSATSRTKLSIVAGTAFIDSGTVAISNSANGTTQISLTDSAGQILSGFLKAPGTAETYTANTILLNPTFDVDVASWSGSNGTVLSVAGGFSGKALQLTRTSGAAQLAFQNANTTSGMLFKASGYVKSGSSGNEDTAIILKNVAAPFAVLSTTPTQSSSAAWVQFGTIYGTLGQTNTQIQFGFWKNTATVGTMLFDEANLVQVLTPSSTGATVVDTSGGGVFNWTSEGATFNRNDSYYIKITRTR